MGKKSVRLSIVQLGLLLSDSRRFETNITLSELREGEYVRLFENGVAAIDSGNKSNYSYKWSGVSFDKIVAYKNVCNDYEAANRHTAPSNNNKITE